MWGKTILENYYDYLPKFWLVAPSALNTKELIDQAQSRNNEITMPSIKQPLRFLRTSRKMPDYRPIELRRIDFKEIYAEPKQQEVQLQAHRCLDCGNPYCEWKCPLHNYIPKWLDLIGNGQLFEAAELCHQTKSTTRNVWQNLSTRFAFVKALAL